MLKVKEDNEITVKTLQQVLDENAWYSDDGGLSMTYEEFIGELEVTPFVTLWLVDQNIIDISYDDIVYLQCQHLVYDIQIVPFEEWLETLFMAGYK